MGPSTHVPAAVKSLGHLLVTFHVQTQTCQGAANKVLEVSNFPKAIANYIAVESAGMK